MQNANFKCNPVNQETQLRGKTPPNYHQEVDNMQINDKTRNSSVSHSNSGLNENDPTQVTYGYSVEKPELLEMKSLDEVINLIKGEQLKPVIEAIRNTAYEEERRKLKKKLPYFVYGIVKGKRCDDNVIQMNGLVMDLDNVPDLPECKEALKALPGARYIFRSPYNGIKVIIPFNQPVSDKNTYLILRECCSANIRDLTGIEPDKPSGWSQACFLSYDPNVIDLGAAQCLNVENTLLTHLQSEDNTTPSEQKEKHPSSEETIQYSISAVKYLAQRKINYLDWLRCGIAIYNYYNEIDSLEKGKKLWLCFADNPHYNDTITQLENIWKKIEHHNYNQIHIGTLFHIAKSYGWEVSPGQSCLKGTNLIVKLDKSRLPLMFQEYINTVNNITNAPDGIILTAMLPFLAVSIGNHLYISSNGTKHYCNVYALLIGPSSRTHKSTCICQAQKMLINDNNNLYFNLVKNKITNAALLKELQTKPCLLLEYQEMGSFFQNFKQDYNKTMLDDITDLFNGHYASNSTLDYSVTIKDSALSIVGAITNDSFYNAYKNIIDKGCGFFQRFLFCYIPENYIPPDNNFINPTTIYESEIHKYYDMLQCFASLPGSYELRFDEEAFSYINNVYGPKYQQLINLEGREGESNTRIYLDYFPRFSIIIYAVKNWKSIRDNKANLDIWLQNNPIDKQTVLEAEYLCNYYRLNNKLLNLASDKRTLMNMEKLLYSLMIAPDHRLSKTDISAKFNHHYKKEETNKFIQGLLDLELIKIEKVTTGNKPTTYYALN